MGAGLSQRQLARTLGVSASAVAQWELGETKPTHDHVAAIAAATGAEVARIFGIQTESVETDANLQLLINHWKRVPPERRTMVLRLIMAATHDSEHPQPSEPANRRRSRGPSKAA